MATATPKKKITWQELEKHNVGTDCWIAVRGKVYNVTSWIPKHPGGYDTLVLNGGKDATQLFEAYHPIKVYAQLANYYVADIDHDGDHPIFPPMSQFYITLKQKIQNYFIENKLDPRMSSEMLIRTFVLVVMAFAFHYFAVISPNLNISLICAVLSGAVYALLSFMPVHEGSHASTTNSPLTWRLLGAVHDFVNGASFYNWCHQHFLGHHPFTNLTNGDEAFDAVDPDIYTNDPDVRRIKPNQRFRDYYKWQAIYVPLLYGLLAVKYRINDLTIILSTKKNGVINVNPLTPWHWSMFIGGKLFWFYYRVVLPCLYIPIWKAMLILVIQDLITSYILAFVFQVNHVIPQAKWPTVDKNTGLVNMDWAEMQIATTLDYAHGSWWTTLLTGALNYQVTHHLFPYISQLHYPAIAPIIRQHCKENGITYHVLPTFFDAFKAHIKYLAIMGHAHSDH
jgi:fatty acid desaturase/predicted heme/steroid binding protein